VRTRTKCEHGVYKYHCAMCSPQIVCEHKVRRQNCPICKPQVTCEHGVRLRGCRLCNPSVGVSHRKRIHAFDTIDEKRFQEIVICDWCSMPFQGELPDIDHDHACCKTQKHCHFCTRGFVHSNCNVHAITHYEWLEKTFGITDDKLKVYRLRFPRRHS
jgi:hypothetical protein